MANLEPFRSPEARVRFVAKHDAVLSSWPVPCVERDVTTAFGTTHIVASGSESAPPVVLLHGAAATATMWRPIIAPLSGSYRCYCVDTITDANKSVATRPVRGVADYIVWLREVFSALGITNARVAGLSYGGWLASQLAVHAPELVNRLLLLCPAATFAPQTIQFYVRIFSSNILRSQSLARRSGRWMSSTPDAPSDLVVDLIVTSIVTSRTVRFEMRPPTVLTDDELRQITAPTVVFIGDREVVYRGGPEAALARAKAHSQRSRAPRARCQSHADARRSRAGRHRDDGSAGLSLL